MEHRQRELQLAEDQKVVEEQRDRDLINERADLDNELMAVNRMSEVLEDQQKEMEGQLQQFVEENEKIRN